jgi:hypothetical protein
MILAFEGWNDAGEAATSALAFLNDAIRSVPLAEIDPEEFYDFTVQRPDVVVDERNDRTPGRSIIWPSTRFRYGAVDGERVVVIGTGVEPHLRWRSYCDCVVRLARTVGVGRVVLLGSYLADVVYSRPVLVTGVASDSSKLEGVEADGSTYEGPTGIVGVLADRLEQEGYDVLCLWAGLPHYITASPNPRGALALVHKLTASLDFRVNDQPLCGDAAKFEERIARLVASDGELSDYVRQLKRRDFAQ